MLVTFEVATFLNQYLNLIIQKFNVGNGYRSIVIKRVDGLRQKKEKNQRRYPNLILKYLTNLKKITEKKTGTRFQKICHQR